MKDFDKHNESVFGQRIKNHEFKFEPAAWDKMEQMLDDEDPGKVVGWRYPYMMILLGVFFVGISFLNPIESESTPVATTKQATDNKTNQVTNQTTKNTETIKTVETIDATTLTTEVKTQATSTLSNKQPATISNVTIVEKTKAIIQEASATTNQIFTKTANNAATSKQMPTSAERNFIQQLPAIQTKQENIQAFIQLDSKLKPLEMDELLAATLPIERSPLLIDKKKVKVGVQAGASVVLAKRSTADQGKLATAIGGFVNFELNNKSTVAVELSYKNGYHEGLGVFTGNADAIRSGDQSGSTNTGSFELEDSYVQQHGYAEVNNVSRVHAVEMPVIYKHKISTRNSVIGGVKPSLMKFSTSTKDALVDFDLSTEGTSFDVGLVAGIEHRFTKNLSVDLRYNQGLIDISNVDQVNNYNSDLALTVKYTF